MRGRFFVPRQRARMDEETTGQAAPEAEAPPGDAVAAADQPASDLAAAIADESQDIDAILADLRRQAEAEATEQATEPEAPPVATAPEAPKPAADAAPQLDPAQVAAYLKAQGYTVEAPQSAPDPYSALDQQMTELSGTEEQYAEARAKALADIPPAPADTDPDWQAKYDARNEAIKTRDAAVADIKRMDVGREAKSTAARWGWDLAMGRLGQSWAALPDTYGLTPERAKRVTEPANSTDAVAAVVEQVSANYEAKLADREKYWQGEVARARGDRSAAAQRGMATAPQPGSIPGGKPAVALAQALFSDKGLPSDDVIERAKRGDFANLSLS